MTDKTTSVEFAGGGGLITGRGYATLIRPHVQDFAESLGLPRTFDGDLLTEDDWSFAIKLHAFVDAALVAALSRRFQADDELKKQITRLHFIGQGGKVEFARALGLLGKDDVGFLQHLNKLRDSAAHRVELVTLELGQYFDGLESQEKSGFYKVVEQIKLGADPKQLIADAPKLAFMWPALAILAKLLQPHQDAEPAGPTPARRGEHHVG